jgi:hypothetical protein
MENVDNTDLINQIIEAQQKLSRKMEEIITLENLNKMTKENLTIMLDKLNEQNTAADTMIAEVATVEEPVAAVEEPVEEAVATVEEPVAAVEEEQAQEGGSRRRKSKKSKGRKTKKGKKRKTRRKTIGKGRKCKKSRK